MRAHVEEADLAELNIEEELDLKSADWDERPIVEVFGSTRTITKYGPPSQNDNIRLRYYFHPTWRSQILSLLGFFALCFVSIYFSDVPFMIIKGRLFTIGSTTYFLHLPMLALLPAILLGRILIHMYDARMIIDERGVEEQVGLVSLNLRQPRLRWEDIRGVEPNQTLWERFLGIGTVLIGSAMTTDVEIVMTGVDNPRGIQLLIQGERDRHLKKLGKGEYARRHMVYSD